MTARAEVRTSAGMVELLGDWVPVDDIGVVRPFTTGCRVAVHGADWYVVDVPAKTVLDAMRRAWRQRR